MLKKLLIIQKEVQIEKPLFNLITNQGVNCDTSYLE